MLMNIDPLIPPRGLVSKCWSFDTRVRAGIRIGNWKLLTGNPSKYISKHNDHCQSQSWDFTSKGKAGHIGMDQLPCHMWESKPTQRWQPVVRCLIC